MNRKQRRQQAKEERRANSKKNFVNCGYKEIPIELLEHDDNLKECDEEILDLISKQFELAEYKLVSNDLSKCIIMKGCSYLDSLCSLRFNITPPDDRAMIRNTMYYVGNFTNIFIGMMASNEWKDNKTLYEHQQEAIMNNEKYVNFPTVHELYPECGLPEKEVIDDIYASFVQEHAQELTSFLQHTSLSDIEGDEEYIYEVLKMILRKTDELIPEAQVQSKNFIVKL
jgi:hypothetical protein